MADELKPPITSEITPKVETSVKEDIPLDTPETTSDIEEEPVEVDAKSLIPQENYRTSPLFYEISNYFGIDEKEYPQAKDYLSLITDWAIEETKSNKLEDILIHIRQLENRLSPPDWGERRYKNVYRYLRLATKRNAFNKALSAFEINPGVNNG